MVSNIIPHHQVQIVPKKMSSVFPGGKTWKVDFLVKGQHKEPREKTSTKLDRLLSAQGLVTIFFCFRGQNSLIQVFKYCFFSQKWGNFVQACPTLL